MKIQQVYGKNADEDAPKPPQVPQLPGIGAAPSLPTGKINENTVDCVNVSVISMIIWNFFRFFCGSSYGEPS